MRGVKDLVRVQNDQNLSIESIAQSDRTWRDTNDSSEMKQNMLKNVASLSFKERVEYNSGLYSEIFVTDKKGANVATYPLTSDYWQGDEDKFINSYLDGVGGIYIGPVEYDESSKADAVQISVPVMDKGKAIGVLVLGTQVSSIEAIRKAAQIKR